MHIVTYSNSCEFVMTNLYTYYDLWNFHKFYFLSLKVLNKLQAKIYLKCLIVIITSCNTQANHTVCVIRRSYKSIISLSPYTIQPKYKYLLRSSDMKLLYLVYTQQLGLVKCLNSETSTLVTPSIFILVFYSYQFRCILFSTNLHNLDGKYKLIKNFFRENI